MINTNFIVCTQNNSIITSKNLKFLDKLNLLLGYTFSESALLLLLEAENAHLDYQIVAEYKFHIQLHRQLEIIWRRTKKVTQGKPPEVFVMSLFSLLTHEFLCGVCSSREFGMHKRVRRLVC